MGRAPNPGAPQRVSAHVVPKAPSFATYDEDEKTTIESGGWEEEPSTTVEQGEVAEKVRALGIGVEPAARPNTSITSTNGSGMSDELTVDDQRANVAIAASMPSAARLVITLGNDAGQAIEVRPGKTYTIGRALENDLVLTDMTVSRKHFEIKHDNGSWVLCDRGSGNGTLVNTRLEDAPFTLANGDVIEIGNTTFRFELPNGVPRVPTSYGVGDDELSTTSGKPLQEPEPATPEQLITSVSRPKTLPPPAPLPRSRPITNRPPPPLGPERPSPQPLGHPPVPASALAIASAPTISPAQGLALHQSPPAATLPLPQMANRPPLQPSALLDPSGSSGPLSALPTTLPGQGPPIHPAHPARLPFSYRGSPGSPELPTLQPRGTSRAMAVVSAQPPRDATSTAQVQPMSYSTGRAAMSQRQYTPPPELSRRTKMALAGAGLALFAAIATIALVKGASSDGTRSATSGHGSLAPLRTQEAAHEPASVPAVETGPTITPIDPPSEPPPPPAAAVAAATAPAPTAGKPEPRTAAPVPAATAPERSAPPTADAKPENAAPTAAVVAPAAVAAAPIVTPIAPSNATATATPRPPAAEPRPPRAQVAMVTRPDRRPARRPERKPDRKAAARVESRLEIDRTDRAEAPAAAKTDKKSARTPQDVKNEASARYRARDFSGAANLVKQALPSFSGADAQELKSLANIYAHLGKSFHIGMAPGTSPVDAYLELGRAREYDKDVGKAYLADIEQRLLVVATKAAFQYMAAKEYLPAFKAVRVSESLGSTSPSNKLVRDKLEAVAGDLLKAASGELSSNPEEARRKAQQVQGMVDARHPLHVRATKLLNGR